MIDIAAHISNLLNQKGLVIVPDLGGFVPQLHQADIYHSKHIIYPPGAHVAFNSNLSDNDGLLAHHIATQEEIEYKKVLHALQTFALLCKNEMANGKSILFEGMGILSYNSAKQIHFKAFTYNNHDEAYFALPSLSLMPIVRQERKIVKLNEQLPEKIKAQKHSIRRIAAIILPLLLFGFLGYQWLPLRNTHKVNMSLIPNQLSEEAILTTHTDNIKKHYHIDYFCDDKVLSTEAPDDNKAKTIENLNVTPASCGKYHIIAGAFRTESSALHLVETLNNKGFKAYIAGQTKGGIYMVSSANFYNKQEALKQLRSWQAHSSPDWWLLIKALP